MVIGLCGFEKIQKRGLHIIFRCVILAVMKEVPVRHPARIFNSPDRTALLFLTKNKHNERIKTMVTVTLIQTSMKHLITLGNKAYGSVCLYAPISNLGNDFRYEESDSKTCGRLRC